MIALLLACSTPEPTPPPVKPEPMAEVKKTPAAPVAPEKPAPPEKPTEPEAPTAKAELGELPGSIKGRYALTLGEDGKTIVMDKTGTNTPPPGTQPKSVKTNIVFPSTITKATFSKGPLGKVLNKDAWPIDSAGPWGLENDLTLLTLDLADGTKHTMTFQMSFGPSGAIVTCDTGAGFFPQGGPEARCKDATKCCAKLVL